MDNLPSLRVNQLKLFQCVGVDYGGPFHITMSKSRGSKSLKAYICLFLYFTTKTSHLESVSGLTSDAFVVFLLHYGDLLLEESHI